MALANERIGELREKSRISESSLELIKERFQASENDLRIQRSENSRLVELLAEKNAPLSELRGKLTAFESTRELSQMTFADDIRERVTFLRDHARQNYFRVNQSHLTLAMQGVATTSTFRNSDNVIAVSKYLEALGAFMITLVNTHAGVQSEMYNEMLRRLEASGSLTMLEFIASVREPVNLVVRFEELVRPVSRLESSGLSSTDWLNEQTKTLEAFMLEHLKPPENVDRMRESE